MNTIKSIAQKLLAPRPGNHATAHPTATLELTVRRANGTVEIIKVPARVTNHG